MTEAEWLAATDPKPMLAFLRGKVGERKLRLLAVACCRRLEALNGRKTIRKVLSVAERFADDWADRKELLDARSRAWSAEASFAMTLASRGAPVAPADMMAHTALVAAAQTINPRCDSILFRTFPALWHAAPNKNAEFVALVRDVFGNPFGPALAVEPAVLVWQNGLLVRLARAAYDVRRLPEGTLDPARLAVLADALEDTGRADAELLGHLRGPGVHVRGCFALDLLLTSGNAASSCEWSTRRPASVARAPDPRRPEAYTRPAEDTMAYGDASCGCLITNSGTWHTPGCRLRGGAGESPPPSPPPIVTGSRVRLKPGYQNSGGLGSGDVFTVERVEDRGGGKVFVYLLGDTRPWKIERFTADR